MSDLATKTVKGATSQSAQPPDIGVRIPLRRDRPQYPRSPGERVRDTSCGAGEWPLSEIPPMCSFLELTRHRVRRSAREENPSAVQSGLPARAAQTHRAVFP